MPILKNLKSLKNLLFTLLATLLPAGSLWAHHNTQAEYDNFDSRTFYIEGTLGKVQWGNPHISIELLVTGGDIPAGEKWRIASHPVQIQIDHGFNKEEFVEGAPIKLHAWKHRQGQPSLWPRAMQIGDGPMKSNMRFADMIDIAKGTFTAMNIVPAANLNGSPSARAGEPYIAKLREMGLVDAEGNMHWPAPTP
ncbi:MAG: DUF6152 family protein [Pseudomonadota bacterium]